MSTKIEKLESNIVKLTFEVSKETFNENIEVAYKKIRNQVNVQGFRKGKAPKQMIVAQYGKEIFHEEALNNFMPELLEKAVTENNLEIVSRPYTKVIEGEGDTVSIEVQVFVKPEVKVENYKGVKVAKADLEVSDDEVLAKINGEREKSVRLVESNDKAIENNDLATLDFEGFMNGVAFEGGKGEDYDLIIGSKTFIDTFEEQLIGLKVGDEKTITVNFPENYGQADLAGKPADFKVKINEIKTRELPELNDEFAKDVSEFNTLDEYKASIKEEVAKSKADNAKNKKENEVMEYLITETKFDLPVVMVENQIDNQVRSFEQQVRQQGIELDQYLQFMGQTMQSLREVYRGQADKQVRGRLILESVAKAEDFDISEAEVDTEIQRIADMYKIPVENIKGSMRSEDIAGIKGDLSIQKALQLVVDSAVEA
ncbi:MAG: trigger factor [Lachnospirales bacterium]